MSGPEMQIEAPSNYDGLSSRPHAGGRSQHLASLHRDAETLRLSSTMPSEWKYQDERPTRRAPSSSRDWHVNPNEQLEGG